MLIKKILASLLFICLVLNDVTGQCSITRNVSIIDQDTTRFLISVDGLLVDSLQHPGQGLCGIRIDFRHEFLGDIAMELVSPSGQSVQLIGPAVPVSGNTSFTRWNVFFIPCNAEPIPDPGFATVWDNLQAWGIFGNYSGQYHPFFGCLEDFSTGPVNGTWTLLIEDVSQFGSGRIQGVQLIFCLEDGVECRECQLDPGDLTAETIEKCESSSVFIPENLQESFSIFPKDTSVYDYQWALFRDTVWVDVIPQDTPFNLEVGNHLLCNIQSSKAETQNLPVLPLDLDRKEANVLFQANNQCVSIGDSCVQIVVYPSTDTLFSDTIICENQIIEVHGIFIDSPGRYTVNLPGIACDTILVLDVIEVDLQPSITSDADSISCGNPVITLTGSVNGQYGQGVSYSWLTINGHILATGLDSVIQVDEPGYYWLTVQSGSCSDTIGIEIFVNHDFPELLILGDDTLTCVKDTITLSVYSDAIVNSLSWSSVQPFIDLGDSIKVYLPGVYEVTMVSDQNCQVSITKNIFALQTMPEVDLMAGSITCEEDTIHIMVTPALPPNFTFQWSGVVLGDETLHNPKVSYQGYKKVEIMDLNTGCRLTDSVFVNDERVFPQISVQTLPLTCARDSVVPILNSDVPIETYSWQGPGFSSMQNSVIIGDPGLYGVTVTTASGCASSISFFVSQDTVRADILLQADSLSCQTDSVAIIITSDKPLVQTTWFDSGGSVISQAYQPFIYNAGWYTLEALDTAGCRSIQNIEVFGSTELPNMTFTIPSIDCTQDTFYIIPNQLDGFLFTWVFPDNSMVSDKIPAITMVGEYLVSVTRASEPDCQEIHRIQVDDFRIYPEINITTDEFTCLKDSAVVMISFGQGNHTWKVYGPSGTFLNQDEMVLYGLGWHYVEAENQFGCETVDSFEIVLNDVHPIISMGPMDTITCLNSSVTASFESSLPSTIFRVYQNNDLYGSGSTVEFFQEGFYTVIGTSANSCEDTLQFMVFLDTLHPDLTIAPLDTITCTLTEIVLSASSNINGVILLWNNQFPNPLQISMGGGYTITATNPKNGCTTVRNVEVIENKIYASYEKLIDTISCKKESAIIGILPQLNYKNVSWEPSNPLFATVGTTQFTSSLPGKYFFMVESNESCLSRDSIILVSDLAPPDIDTLIVPPINCFNPEVLLEVVPTRDPDTILWSGPGNLVFTGSTILTKTPGEYTIHIVGENGCVWDTLVIVERKVEPPVFTTFTDSLSCKKGKGVIGIDSADNILEVLWTGPSNYSSSLPTTLVTVAGIYQVVVTSTNGCKDTAEITVPGDYLTPVLLVKDSFFIPCDSSMITLIVESSDSLVQYYWEREGVPFSDQASPMTNMPGLYTVWVTGSNGCRSIQEFDVIQVRLPAGFTYTTDSITCAKPIALLTASSPNSAATFTWISPGGQINQTDLLQTGESGLFQLIVKDENKCLDTVIVQVSIDTMTPRITILQEGILACEQRSVTLRIEDTDRDSLFTYLWFGNANQILSPLDRAELQIMEPGVFSVSVTDAKNGCRVFTTFEVVEVPSLFNRVDLTLEQPTCEDFNFGLASIDSLNGYPPYQVKLNGIFYQNETQFSLLAPGNYLLQIKDSIGCTLDTFFTIENAGNFLLPIPQDTILFLGDSLVLFSNLSDSTWLRYEFFIVEKGDTLCSPCQRPVTLMPSQSTVYVIGAKSKYFSCEILQSIRVSLRDEIFSGIPNIMSRNALSEKNKLFYIPQTRGIQSVLSMEIYDKWGNPLFGRYNFPPGDPAWGWDGSYQGKNVETGVYIVICRLQLTNNRIITYQGDVTILD